MSAYNRWCKHCFYLQPTLNKLFYWYWISSNRGGQTEGGIKLTPLPPQKNILSKSPALLGLKHVDSFHPSVALHIKTSRLICIANQMTGFYMKCNAGLKWLKTRIFFEGSITFLLEVEIRTEEYWRNVALKMISNYLELRGVIRHLFSQKAIS